MRVRIRVKDGHEVVELNRRKAIHLKCLNCASWHPGEVSQCSYNGCPLFPFRSGRGNQIAKAREKAIRQFCLWCSNDQVGEVTKCPSLDCSLYIYRKGGIDQTLESISFEKLAHIDSIFLKKTTRSIQSVI